MWICLYVYKYFNEEIKVALIVNKYYKILDLISFLLYIIR
jgi:hypothetical protein